MIGDDLEFSRTLRQARRAQQITKRFVASVVGKTTNAVDRWECLKMPAFPSESDLERVAEAYNIPISKLKEVWGRSKEARDSGHAWRKREKPRPLPPGYEAFNFGNSKCGRINGRVPRS